METIKFDGESYPSFQASGFAARFAFPFAKEVCKGSFGYDIGCCKPEWAFPGAFMIDPDIDPRWHADNLPFGEAKYIFSSHCLEHVPDWVSTLIYWTFMLAPGGTLFLYLPHYDQKYWRPWNNRKHKHVLFPSVVKDMLVSTGSYEHVFVSERDLNHSFMVIAKKHA